MKKDVWKDKWQKDHPLNHGGQSFTHKVTAPGAIKGPFYVLKELKHQHDSERRGRMIQEVALLKKLGHPRLAKCVDSNARPGNTDEELYVVTEYIPGPVLTDFVLNNPVPVTESVKILRALLSTLDYCHNEQTIHRDIKPDNIIVRASNPDDPVLIDFGLSFNEETRPTELQTESAQHLGNRFLVLPEYGVRGSDKRDRRSDIAQCVGILFYLITAQYPDHLTDGAGLLPHQRPAALATISLHGPAISEQLNRIFTMGFQTQLLRRFQSTTALMSEIEALQDPKANTEPTFDQLLDQMTKLVLETPENVQTDRINEVKELILKTFQQFSNLVTQKLVAICARSGNFAVVPPPSNPTAPPPSRPDPIWSQDLGLHKKYEPIAWIRVAFLLTFTNSEFVLLASHDRLPAHDNLGVLLETAAAVEVTRFGLFDDKANSILRMGFENYFSTHILPTLQR